MTKPKSQTTINSIRFKIALLIMVVIIGFLTTLGVTTRYMHEEAKLAALEKAKSDMLLGASYIDCKYPGDWAIIDNKLYKGSTLMNGNFTLIDEIAMLTGDTCTIFQGSTRVATNVIRDGNRAINTTVSKEVAAVVLEKGQEYFGQAEVVGVKYQTAYQPLRDVNGKIIGIWYVGTNTHFAGKIIENSRWGMVSTFGLILLMIASVIWLFTKSLDRPVKELVVAANRLARGDLDTQVNVLSQDEIGLLAKSFEKMRVELKQQYTDLCKTNELLQDSEKRFVDLLKNIQMLAVILDEKGNITFCNDYMLQLTGWQLEEVLYRDWVTTFVPEENREETLKAFEQMFQGVTIETDVKEIQTRTGERHLILWNKTLIRDLHGNIVGTARIGEDITVRQKSEEKLRSAHQQLLDIIEFLPDATFVINKEKKVIAWNRAIEEMTGVSKEDIVGKDDYAYAVPFYNEKRPVLIDLIFLNDQEVRKMYRYVKRKDKTLFAEAFITSGNDGKGTYLWLTASPLFNSSGEVVGAIESIRDITENKQVEKRLQYMATHDSLTNIPNRYMLEETLKRTVAKAKRGKKGALLFIDLDNFKIVNDTLGHSAGDEVLISSVNILKSNLRTSDFLARLGGDEFAILLEDTSLEEAWLVAEKLRRAIDDSEVCLVMYRHSVNLSLSIGVVVVDGTLDSQKLLSLADTALYRAKDGGRNKVDFIQADEDAAKTLSRTNQLVTLIKFALKENRFELYYQPVVTVEDKKVLHYEALLRLRDAQGELVSPGKFIPVAERFGLMPQIDRWVVQNSLEKLVDEPELNIFINISGLSLGDEELLVFIEESIKEKGIEPVRIGFEITETAAVRDLKRAENWILRLKKLGCRFALDDFGIGFSSFTYLRMIPADYIKIDGSFISNLNTEPTNIALVQAINTIARTLGKKTVAEFVESQEILSKLEELKIDFAQGYYLGKPAPMPRENGEKG